MKRRAFLAGLGAVAWPVVARGQQKPMPVIGFLGSATAKGYAMQVAAIRQGMSEGGYVEGRNFAIEYRWANEDYDRLPELASDLVRREVAVIVTTGGGHPIKAAKAATATIPVVFATGGDPVANGFVASLNRPGGNATGVTYFSNSLAPKRLEIIREVLPNARVIAMLMNPNSPAFERDLKEMEAAAQAIKVQFVALHATGASDLEAAFTTVVQKQIDALIINNDAVLTSQRLRIVTLAERYKMPAIYPSRQNLGAGLISYGTDNNDMLRQAGLYVTRILKGERPSDLPVLQPTKFELIVNLKTAKALGLNIPESFLLRADEVIE